MYYLGVDTGGTFTDFVALNARTGEDRDLQGALRAGRPRKCRAGRDRAPARSPRDRPLADWSLHLRDHGGDECGAGAQGRPDRPRRDQGHAGRHRDSAPVAQPPLRPLHPQAPAAGASTLALRGGRAYRRPRRGRDSPDRRGSRACRRPDCTRAVSSRWRSAACSPFWTLTHERRLREAIAAAAPDVPVSISCDVSPQFREYERATTTVMNAYVMPRIERLASRLEAVVGRERLRRSGPYHAVQRRADERRHRRGVIRCAPCCPDPRAGWWARSAWRGRQGSTTSSRWTWAVPASTSASCVAARSPCRPRAGSATIRCRCRRSTSTLSAPAAAASPASSGVRSRSVPRARARTRDRSATARAGLHPTSTDAAVTLGYIDPAYFADGEMRLDVDAARRAIEEACRRTPGDGCGRGGSRHRPRPGGRDGHRHPRRLGGARLGSARISRCSRSGARDRSTPD